MADATVVALAKAVVALIQTAIDDPAHPLGDGLEFNLKRVSLIKQWVIGSDEHLIRIRVATLGTEGAPEMTRTTYGVKYVIPVAVIKKLLPTETQGETIDDENAEVLAASDALIGVVQCLTQIFMARENLTPAMDGLAFVKWTHQDASNKQGLIFNQLALSERRQYESTMFLHYEAQFSA